MGEAVELWNARATRKPDKPTRMTKEQELGILSRRLANFYKQSTNVCPSPHKCSGLTCGCTNCDVFWYRVFASMNTEDLANAMRRCLAALDTVASFYSELLSVMVLD